MTYQRGITVTEQFPGHWGFQGENWECPIHTGGTLVPQMERVTQDSTELPDFLGP